MERMETKLSGILASIALACGLSMPSQAIVSSHAEFVIPYERLQAEDICLDTQLMQASFGIPLFSLLVGVFNPTMTLQGGGGTPISYQNINLLTEDGGITYNYIFDAVSSNGTLEYKLSIDMANVNTANGNTTTGRQKTVDKAKLAVISTVKTAEVLHGAGNFRVWVKIDNLPSQSGLSGTTLLTMPSTTATGGPMWPYTSSSSVLLSYIGDVISSGC